MAGKARILDRGFTGLLSLVLKYRAYKAPNNDVYLCRLRAKLHRFVYSIRERFEEDFPEFEDLHFMTAGAFPYSEELAEAIWVLTISGALSGFSDFGDFYYVTWFQDSAKALKEEMAERLGDDEHLRLRFEEMAEVFLEVVKTREEVVHNLMRSGGRNA